MFTSERVPHRYNPKYIHHKGRGVVGNISQVVFGLQDGMVSTLGAITGVAIGSGEHYIVLLAGVAIISVESVSMGVGEYISSRSEKKVMERILAEEREEIKKYPEEEHSELEDLFVRDGWPKELSKTMANTARENPELMLAEMAYRELNIASSELEHPVRNGAFMFFAYIGGGLIPLLAYFFLPISNAILISVPMTLVALFVLGAGLTKYTKQSWLKNGLHMFVFGGAALAIGLVVGVVMRTYFGV
ncbi:MAG: VIT1/CCC1 transporter family protein [Parcubacteria group bacterium]|nr:VIT1/CCC1 transporter family protein [Parcubacteria group bacterium]